MQFLTPKTMKESSFINKNKEKWKRFEKLKNDKNTNPEELGELFTEVNEDLSFAQTFYERRTVRAYLNQAAQGVYSKLYKQKGESLKSYWKSWTLNIPLELYKSRKNLLFGLVMFLLWTIVGAVTTHFYPEFTDMAAGSGMIERTEEFIARDDPFGFYGDTDRTSMFFGITLNNIKVAFYCFLGGILFSWGTHYFVFKNAMMLGAFQYYYVIKGLGLSSFLAIWIHGAFEISAIVIAAGAGYTLGHSILFPGSYSRLQSFQLGAKRGLRIMMALVPVFILAGFLESFVTRNYLSLADWAKWCIILFSFALMLFYFVIYPQILARKHPELLKEKESVNALPETKIELYELRKVADVISDTFHLYRYKFGQFMRINIALTLPLILLISTFQFIVHFSDMGYEYSVDWTSQLSFIFGNPYATTFVNTDLIAFVFWIFPLSTLTASVVFSVQNEADDFTWPAFFGFLKKKALKLLLGVAITYLSVALLPLYLIYFAILLYPFLFNMPTLVLLLKEKVGVSKAFSFGAKMWINNLTLILALIMVFGLFAQPIALVFSTDENIPIYFPDLLDLLVDFVKMILNDETSYTIEIANGIRIITYIIFLIIVLPIFVISSLLSSYSLIERMEAKGLREEFKRFGKRSRIKENGLDYEA